jgi:peptide/nickel transport system ATP-binding protein
MPPLLSVEDLSVTFRTGAGLVRAVRGVGFSVSRASSLALVGESGCGKTATALSLMRLVPSPPGSVSGSVWFEGRDLLALPEASLREVRGRRIAMVFQDPMSSLNPVRTVGVQLEEMLRVHLGLGRAAARGRAVELLGSVGIPAPSRQLSAYPHQLSGGMRQRVMIAMALSCDPEILIADEPTTALDVSIQAQILELLRTVTEERGMSLVMISHDLSVVAGLADQIAVMYAGEIVEMGSTERIFAHPRHPYTRGLLECIPRLDRPRVGRLRAIEGGLPDLTRPVVGCSFAERCAFVLDRCRAEAPVLSEKAERQLAACWVEVPAPAVEDVAGSAVSGGPAAQVSRSAEAPGSESGAVAGSVSRSAAPPADPGALVRVEDLAVHFRLGSPVPFRRGPLLRAVDGVTFDVPRGRTLSLVGESGCGKSTTGRAVLGLAQVTAGRVLFDGQDLVPLGEEGVRRLRPRMQMIFQDPYGSLDPRMPVGSAVAEPLLVHQVGNGGGVSGRVSQLLDLVGLPARTAERYPHQLSGGQRQRAGIARSLALNPSLIVADEPTSALDVSVRAQILNLLRDLQEEHALSYVFISHDLSVVRHMSEAVAVMYLGKIVEVAPRDVLYADPRHPYTQGLLATVPVAEPAVERGRRRAAIQGDVPNPAAPPAGCRFNTRCPLAFDRCFAEEPPLAAVDAGHRAACFLAGETGGA